MVEEEEKVSKASRQVKIGAQRNNDEESEPDNNDDHKISAKHQETLKAIAA